MPVNIDQVVCAIGCDAEADSGFRRPVEDLAQFVLGFFQNVLLLCVEILAGAVD